MSFTQRLCFVAIAVASGALVAPGCLLPDKTVREEAPPKVQEEPPPELCPEANGLTAFLGGGECEACVASRCCEEAALCSGEAACDAHVGCTRDCSASADTVQPVCFDRCRRSPKTDLAESVFICADTECREECSLGTTFGCAGDYRWPVGESDQVTVNFRIIQPNVFPATPYPTSNQVMPCRFNEWPCAFVSSKSVETVEGRVALSIPTPDEFGDPSNWNGYFRIEGSEDLRTTLLFQNRGEYRDREVEDLPIPSDSFLELAENIGAGEGGGGGGDAGPSEGFVVGQVLDCRGLVNYGAEGLIVRITPEDPAEEAPEVLYLRDNFPLSLPATTSEGRFLAKFVPPGRLTVSVLREGKEGEDGDPIADEQMIVEAGALTILGIYPEARR